MITVEVKRDGQPIALMEINNISEDNSEFADYKVHYAINRGSGMGLHNRIIYGFPRKYFNVFGLLLQSLNSLNEKDLKLERDFDPDQAPVSTDMGGGLDRTLPALPRWLSRLHRN